MRTDYSIVVLFFLLVLAVPLPAWAQGKVYQVVDVTDLPEALNSRQSDSCRIEFREEWTIDVAGSMILKTVQDYGISCADGPRNVPNSEKALRIKDISYEFFFLDPQKPAIRELQAGIIALVDACYPVNKIYKLPAQLLSVHFHEEWVLAPAQGELRKRVRGITPVIWQQRQTAEGKPLNDGESGLPVYYKLELPRIDLRQP